MQSDGNSFWGGVFVYSFNMAYRNDKKDQKKEKQIFWDLYYKDFKSYRSDMIEENAYLKNRAHNNKELIKFGFSVTVVLVRIFV